MGNDLDIYNIPEEETASDAYPMEVAEGDQLAGLGTLLLKLKNAISAKEKEVLLKQIEKVRNDLPKQSQIRIPLHMPESMAKPTVDNVMLNEYDPWEYIPRYTGSSMDPDELAAMLVKESEEARKAQEALKKQKDWQTYQDTVTLIPYFPKRGR